MSGQTALYTWMLLAVAGSVPLISGRNFVYVPPSEFDCSWRADGFYPSPSSCQTYYMCMTSEAYRSECGDGTSFDPITGYCLVYTNVTCKITVTSTVPTTTAQSPDQGGGVTCAAHANGEYFKDPVDCSYFYICDNGNLVHVQCPTTLVFNPQASTCDFSANVPGC